MARTPNPQIRNSNRAKAKIVDIRRFTNNNREMSFARATMALEAIQHQSLFMELLGVEVPVSSAEDLVVSKLDWARDSESEMQLRDVANLLKVKGLDLRYIETWVEKLGLKTIYGKAKNY